MNPGIGHVPANPPVPPFRVVVAINEGDLVKGTSPDVFVVMNGVRRHIPDELTFNELGYDNTRIRHLSDVDVASIPLGPPLPRIRLMTVNEDSDLNAGHFMTTGASLLSTGKLQATTRTRTVTWIGGYTGGVQVVLVDPNDVAIAASQLHTFGVDGRAFGRHDRADDWTEQFDPSVASRASRIAVIHAWVPKVPMDQMIHNGIIAVKVIADIIAVINQSGNGAGSVGNPA